MLSVAKHLLFRIENKHKRIPRCARDDIRRRVVQEVARLA